FGPPQRGDRWFSPSDQNLLSAELARTPIGRERSSTSHLLLQLRQQIHGFEGRQPIQVGGPQLLQDFFRERREHGELHRGSRGLIPCQLAREPMLCALVLRQYFPRPMDHLQRQSRQLGDLDSVAAVSRSRLNLAQEDNPAAGFLHGNVIVLHARELFRQLGQLVVVGREEGLCPGSRLQIFNGRPGNGQSIVSRRAATDLIEQHQRTWRRGVQDGGG